MRAVLRQRVDCIPYVIYCASMILSDAQSNYSTVKKEILPVMFALFFYKEICKRLD